MFLQLIRKKDYFIADEENALEEKCGIPKNPESEVAQKRLTDKRLRKMPAAQMQQAFYVIGYKTAIYMSPIRPQEIPARTS